jgi:ribosomal-protein-alanine N-acetyltransferase
MILDFSIITKRLIICSLGTSDVSDRYLAWMLDPAVLNCLEVRFSPPTNIADLQNFVIRANFSNNEILLGIFLRDSRRHIGNIKLGPICTRHQRADIGFIIGEQAEWGKGYATEAISAVCNYAFSDLRLSKVAAGCYASNKGSARALINSGFSQEGRLRDHVLLHEERDDVLLFGLTNPSSVTLEK